LSSSSNIDRKSLKGYDTDSMMTNGSGGGVDLNLYNPNDFELIKYKKELWESGINLFNKKPLKGIKYLQENGLIGLSETDIAEFLFNDERLDKTSIGDFLGLSLIFMISKILGFLEVFKNFQAKATFSTRK
jgi:brefeldin A-inhibited guanine nucleotide-exchange protein